MSKLVHLLGFIIRIYHDEPSHECQIARKIITTLENVICSVDKELSHSLGVTNVHYDIQNTIFMQESNETT